MRVLVTGGAGFIGRYLVKSLIKKDHDVIILDNLSSPDANPDDLNVLPIDVTDYNKMKNYFDDVDIVFHLAALPRVRESISDPLTTFKENCVGTHNVFNACKENNVKKIIFTSSREVFGDAQYLPVDEKHPKIPKSPYAASKLYGEALCNAFWNSYGIKFTIVRPSNVYGWGDSRRVIPVFIRKALEDGKLPVFGGEQTLDFTYTTDTVDGLMSCLNKASDNEDFNLGIGEGCSILELANKIIEIIGSGKIQVLDPVLGEVESYVANIEKAKKILGYNPKISFDEGLKKTVEAFKKFRK